MGYREDRPPGQVQHPKRHCWLNWEHAMLQTSCNKTTRGAPESAFPNLCRLAVVLLFPFCMCKQGANGIAPILSPSRFFSVEVMSLPTFQIYRNGEQVASSTGASLGVFCWNRVVKLVPQFSEESFCRAIQLIWFQCPIQSNRFEVVNQILQSFSKRQTGWEMN